MDKKVFGVCDSDKEYAEVLSHFIGRREGDRFSVMAFTRMEAIEGYLSRGSFDVLMMTDSFAEEFERKGYESYMPEGMTYILSERRDEVDYGYPSIYKYQSSEAVLREVVGGYDKKNTVKKRRSAGPGVIGVYSPVKRCGKTKFSFALAKEYADRFEGGGAGAVSGAGGGAGGIGAGAGSGASIFISLEDFCGPEFIKANDEMTSISDILYRCQTLPEDEIWKDAEFSRYYGVDILGGARCPEDIRSADCSIIRFALEKLKDEGSYPAIVVDIADAVAEPEKIFEACDEIYIMTLSDESSKQKLSAWRKHMENGGYKAIIEKMRFLSPPDESFDDFGAYARAILDGKN